MKLPVLSGEEVIKALTKAGFYAHHKTGSHVIMKKDNPPTRFPVPTYKSIKRDLLRRIIKEAGLTREDFLDLVK